VPVVVLLSRQEATAARLTHGAGSTGKRPQTRQRRSTTLRRCSAEAGTRGVATTARGLLGPGLVAILRLRLMEV
jgi:hypothetical protein